MDILLTSIHVMVCLVLILVVLLQRGKGADMGAMLGGGGANTVFGGRGAGNFLTKTTAACAVIFMLTSLTLSYMGSIGEDDLLLDDDFLDEPLPSSGLEEVEDAGALEEIPTGAAAGDAEDVGSLEEIPQPSGAGLTVDAKTTSPSDAAGEAPATP